MPRNKKETEKPKKYTRSRDLGEVVYIGAEVDPEIAEALDTYCDGNGIKKRFVIEVALRKHLTTLGVLGKKAE